MSLSTTLPVRKGRPICINLDSDAELLLRTMVPHRKRMGSFIAELIRREAMARSERHQLLKNLAEIREASDA